MATDREARRRIKELAARVDEGDDALAGRLDATRVFIQDYGKRLDSLDSNLAQARGELTKLIADLAAEEARVDGVSVRVDGIDFFVTELAEDISDLRARVEALEGNDQPDPPPTSNWRTVKTLTKVSDWNSRLTEGFQNASITDTPQGIRFWIPGPQDVGSGRCEVQAYFGKEGMVCAYEWTFMIPSRTKLTTVADAENLVHQGHGDNRAGFTSGTSIDGHTEAIKVKVKGGHETSTAGSHRYEYEDEFVFGTIQRDRVHVVRHEVHWHRERGYYRARLDNGPWAGVSDVPTWPLGDKDGEPTTQIMVRYGWYPNQGIAQGDMEMFCGPMLFQEAA